MTRLLSVGHVRIWLAGRGWWRRASAVVWCRHTWLVEFGPIIVNRMNWDNDGDCDCGKVDP